MFPFRLTPAVHRRQLDADDAPDDIVEGEITFKLTMGFHKVPSGEQRSLNIRFMFSPKSQTHVSPIANWQDGF